MLSARKEGLSTAKVVSTCGTVKRISPSAWMQGLRIISRLLTISCSLELVANQRSPPRIDVSFVRNQQNCFKETVSVPAKQKKRRRQNAVEFAEYGPWVVLRFGVNFPVLQGVCRWFAQSAAAAHWFDMIDRDIDTMNTCAVACKRPWTLNMCKVAGYVRANFDPIIFLTPWFRIACSVFWPVSSSYQAWQRRGTFAEFQHVSTVARSAGTPWGVDGLDDELAGTPSWFFRARMATEQAWSGFQYSPEQTNMSPEI